MKRQGQGSEDCVQKRKKVRTSPTNTSLLPPCKVCHQQAAGFHYGVNTCEACKGFFRRSLIREEPYKCLGKGNCDIGAGKRKICPQCRYLKCLAVGMSKDNIKTGRYTHAKRTQDTLEYYQTLGKTPVGHSADPNLHTHLSRNSAVNTLLDSLMSEVSESTPPASSTTTFDGGTWDMFDSGIQLCPLSPSSSDQLTQSMERSHVELCSLPPLHDVPCHAFQDMAQSEEEEESGMELPSFSSVSTLPERTDSSASWSDHSLHEEGTKVALPLVSSLFSQPAPSNFLTEDQEDSVQVCVSSPTCLDEFLDQSVPAVTITDDDCCRKGQDVLDDTECEKMVHHLVQAHHKLVHDYSDSLTPEVMRKKQMDCYENCKLKRDVFGSMNLSEKEYQDIYQRTGLDADNRQPIIDRVMAKTEKNICSYIAFVKTIPGFSQLSVNDQARLIRDNRSEFRILCNYWGFNDELKVVTFPSGITQCIHELAKVWGWDLFLYRFQCAHILQQLQLTRAELVVLKCLMVVTVGRQDVDESDKVSAIQWRMAQCLLWTLKQSRSRPQAFYARIIGAMCRLRDLCERFYQWVNTNPFQAYSQVQNNSLLAEWFSGDCTLS